MEGSGDTVLPVLVPSRRLCVDVANLKWEAKEGVSEVCFALRDFTALLQDSISGFSKYLNVWNDNNS